MMEFNNSRYKKRKLINQIAMALSLLTVAIALFFLAWILITLFTNGFQYLTASVFTETTPPPGSNGGLSNAIFGSLLMVIFATLIGTPIGILAGTYLAEYGKTGWLAPTTRFINDILLSAPSIVIGLFVYEVAVHHIGHFSGWAGAIALSLIIIPVVVRTTENMMLLVPSALREAAAALGAPYWKVIVIVV
ncbi:MAG: ABC transporter permease subunit, partial [Methylophilaceae bacterium]|nr:ABC transporter permease subunit [Methylophilaceae bacterium]